MSPPKKKTKSNNLVPIDNSSSSDEEPVNTERVMVISSLIPSLVSWMVYGFVYFKTKLIPFKNNKGKYFIFEIKDKTGQIRVVSFGDEAIRFSEIISVGKVYSISRAIITLSPTQFKSKNPYEIHTSSFTVIEESLNAIAKSLMSLSDVYEFKTIEEIFHLPIKFTCSIIAIIHSYSKIVKYTKKESK